MLGEVVTPHEALLTLGTLKALVPCVGSSMSLEFIAPSESLSTKIDEDNTQGIPLSNQASDCLDEARSAKGCSST